MYEDFVPARASVTPNYALALIRDSHRQQCQYDPEADPSVELTFDSTVAEWRLACDLVSWRELADASNAWWGFECSREEWRAALEPATERTLRDVCELLARHAKIPRPRPAMLLGSPCVSGGTFLTIRALLGEAGADAREIAPSTPLDYYARRYLHVFLGPISWLAPDALPPVKILDHPISKTALWGTLAGLILMPVGACTSLHALTIIGVSAFAVSYAMTWIAARWLGPSRVEFGNLKTFRDLATSVARHVRS